MLYETEYGEPGVMEPTSTDAGPNATELYDYDYNYDAKGPCTLMHNYSVELALRPYVHPIICVLGAVGNSLVILTYALYKRARCTSDVYLLHMAVSDLLFVATLPLITYNEQWAWPMGTAACKLLRGAYSVNLYSCMLLLACVSADRYLAIVHARRFRLRSLLCSRALCAAVWVLAFVFSLPTFLFCQTYMPSHRKMEWQVEEEEEEEEQQVPVCGMWFSDTQMAGYMRLLVPGSQLALGFLLPLVVMMFCYSQVLVRLLRANTFQRHRAVRVVLAVVAVFLLCHLPYSVTRLCHTLILFQPHPCHQADMVRAVLTVTETVAYLHCCLNPLLYAFLGVKFRNNLKKVLQDLWCVSRVRSRASRRSVSSRATSDSFVSSRRSVTSFEI